MIEPKHQCLLSYTYTATDGFRVGPSPLTTFARSHDDELSNRTASSFSLITTQTNSTLHLVQKYIEQTVGPCRPPLWRRGSDPSTRDKVCADHEEALILSNSTGRTEWNVTPSMAILRTILRYLE